MADNDAAASLYSFDGSSDRAESSSSIKSPNRDSFSELALLMRAKKPYAVDSKSARLPAPPLAHQDSNRSTCTIDSGNTLSSLPKPANAPETVAEFLQQQELSASSASQAEVARSFRLNKTTQSLRSASTTVIRKRDKSITPLEKSATPSDEKDSSILNEHIMILERNVLALKKSNDVLREAKATAEMNLNILKTQHENSKDQASAMFCRLTERDKTVQNQQLDINELERRLDDSESKLKELRNAAVELNKLQDIIDKLTRERDEAVQAICSVQHHNSKLEGLAGTITKQKKTILELRQELVKADLKNADLEDDIQDLKRLSNGTDLADLKTKLHQKTVECDRQCHQIKTIEFQLQHCQERLQDITKNGMSLQGAVHLVKPNAQAQLPKAIIACSECYANNLTCDNQAICRNCTERDKSCARWRCSLKHKLGNCPLSPCKFPHDPQGWLVLREERPEW